LVSLASCCDEIVKTKQTKNLISPQEITQELFEISNQTKHPTFNTKQTHTHVTKLISFINNLLCFISLAAKEGEYLYLNKSKRFRPFTIINIIIITIIIA